jgi:hypothetical protein
MTDEAHFHLSGCASKQTFRSWADENPQQLHQRPLHSAHVTVWCGMANFGVIGSHFFEDEDGRAVTVTAAHNVEMLRNFLTSELSCYGLELSTMWFQQDGVTTHTAGGAWRSFGKCFQSMLFHCVASFHSLHVCQSLCL